MKRLGLTTATAVVVSFAIPLFCIALKTPVAPPVAVTAQHAKGTASDTQSFPVRKETPPSSEARKAPADKAPQLQAQALWGQGSSDNAAPSQRPAVSE